MTTEERNAYILEGAEEQKMSIQKEKDQMLWYLRDLENDLRRAIDRVENDDIDLNSFCGNGVNNLLEIMKISGRITEKRAAISMARMILLNRNGE